MATVFSVIIDNKSKNQIICDSCEKRSVAKGLGLQSIKKNPALIPLYVCVGAGACAAVFYIFRLATRNPDVTWNRSANPEPWQEYKEKQYKFYSPIRDYSKIKSPAPNYEE